jgi:acyl carrier protein
LRVKAKIRALLEQVGEFPAGADVLRDDADLHAAGLSSYGTVELMVRIEEEFGVEFPDALLTRATFGSVDSMAAAVASLLERGGAPAARADAA